MGTTSRNVPPIALIRQEAVAPLRISIEFFRRDVRLGQCLSADGAPAALADEIRDLVAAGRILSSSPVSVSVSHGSSRVSGLPWFDEVRPAAAQVRDDTRTP
jgi:hypothetical protein